MLQQWENPVRLRGKGRVEGEKQEHRGGQNRRSHQPGLQQCALRLVLIGRVAPDQDQRCEDGRHHGQVPGVEESQAPYRQGNRQRFQGVALDPSWAGDLFGQHQIEAKEQPQHDERQGQQVRVKVAQQEAEKRELRDGVVQAFAIGKGVDNPGCARHHHQVSSGKNPETGPVLAVNPLTPTHPQNPPEPQPCARKNSRTPSRLPNRIIRNGEAAANFIARHTPDPDTRTRLYSIPNTADASRAGTREIARL